jgi:hypothetical protein
MPAAYLYVWRLQSRGWHRSSEQVTMGGHLGRVGQIGSGMKPSPQRRCRHAVSHNLASWDHKSSGMNSQHSVVKWRTHLIFVFVRWLNRRHLAADNVCED